MAALIREPPRRQGHRGGSACARRTTSSTSRRSRASRAAAATAGRGVLERRLDRGDHRVHPPRVPRCRRAALDPSGPVLVDKPAGPSSFAIVADVRRRTGARTGHAGTLDPFATGLLLVLSGRRPSSPRASSGSTSATSPTSTCATARPRAIREGEVVAEHEPPRRRRAGAATRDASRRGRATGPRRLGGEDRRRARLPAAPARRRGRDAAAPLARRRARARRLRDGVARLDLLVSSGTYVRSIADALGGHCATLRRTEVGPFRSRRPTRSGSSRPRRRSRGCDGRRGRLASSSRSRARSRSAPSTASTSGTGACSRPRVAAGLDATVVTFDPHPRVGARQRRRAADDARAAARAAGRGRRRGGARRRLHLELARSSRRRSPSGSCARSGRRSWSRARTSASAGAARRPRAASALGFDVRPVRARGRRLVDADPRAGPRRRGRRRRPGCSGGHRSSTARSSPATHAGARSAIPTANLRQSTRACSCRATASTRARRSAIARRSRSARTRTTAAASAASRRSCSTSRATCTGSACRRALAAPP